MDVVVIPQSMLAMSAHFEGSLNFVHKQHIKSVQKEWSKGRNDRFSTNNKERPDVTEAFQASHKSNFVVIDGVRPQRTFAVALGESYTFHHRDAASELNNHHVNCIKSLTEVALLKVTKDCVSWIANCKYLVLELENLYEEQCSPTDECISSASRDFSKSSRLLNLFERCRIQFSGFEALKSKICLVASVARENYIFLNALESFWTSVMATKFEILQSISNTFRLEVEIYAQYVTAFDGGQVDACKQISERVENLCLLFEKYGKLALMLRILGVKGHSSRFDVILPTYFGDLARGTVSSSKIGAQTRVDHMRNPLSYREHETTANVNNLLCFIARLRAPYFTASALFNLERLMRRKLLRKLSGQFGSTSSLRTSPRSQPGVSPNSDTDLVQKNSSSEKPSHVVAKRIQKRFWYDLLQLSEDENLLASTLVNVCSSCLQKERTIKKHNPSIVKHTTDNPNGIVHNDRAWHNSNLPHCGHIGIDEFYLTREGKRVHFSDASSRPERKDLQDLYMKELWQEYLHSYRTTFYTSWSTDNEFSILPRIFHDQELGFSLLTCFSPSKYIVGKNDVSSGLISAMTSLTTLFSAMSFIGNWDCSLLKILPCSLKDRCRPLYKDDESPSLTQTGFGIMKCFQPLLKLANVTSKVAARAVAGDGQQKAQDSLWEMQLKSLSSLLVQLQVTLVFFMSKAQQFLASGSWELFFSVVKNDLNAVVTDLEPLSTSLTLLSQSMNSHCAPETFMFSIVEEIQRNLQELKGLEGDSITKLINNVRERSILVWGQTMPATKQWRKRGVTVIPFEANPYVELAATQILSPLMDTMGHLEKSEVEKIFCKCVHVFTQTWMDYFLEREIKFSYYGAHQLRLDLNYFRHWLSKERPHFNQDVATSALNIQVFDEFDGVINLLCCQPQSRHRGGSEGDLSTVNSASSSSVSQGSFSGSANFEDIIREVDIPNKQQWLMLRAKGSRKTRLLCLSAPE